jgi:adenosylcobinamide-GDP ribazoletransferase
MPWAGLRLAVTLLTAIPLPGSRTAATGAPSRATAAAAMYWAPAVGLALGAAAAGILLLASRVGHTGALLASALAIAAVAAITRALHLDGLADMADGLGSRQPPRQALDIMKRSDIGPYGVVTLVLTLLVQTAALAQADKIGRGPVAMATAAVAARLAITVACRRGVPSARAGGLGALVAGTVHPAAAMILVVAVIGGATAFGWIYAVAAAAGLAVSLGLTALAVRRFGGITGDVLGAITELSSAVSLLVSAIS